MFLAIAMKIGGMQNNSQSQAMHAWGRGGPVILPSLLQCDFGNLQIEIERLEAVGIRGFHLDVMDGHFVPNFTYGMPIVSAVRKVTRLPVDVHLMMSNPGDYLEQFAEAGADCLTIHAEIATEKESLLKRIRQLGLSAGIAINPGTPLSEVEPLLELCDLLLIMSVDAGFGGQAFNPVALDKLESVKDKYPGLLLEVDGGVNQQTIANCVRAGARLLVVGSAIFGQQDYRRAVERLTDAMGW